jgi:hypothetical protein
MPPTPPNRRQQRGVLDDLLGAAEAPPPAVPAPVAAAALPPVAASPVPADAAALAAAAAARPAGPPIRLTVIVPAGLVDRARDVVYHSPDLTLSGLAATALGREIERLEELRGEPFPARRGPIRTGRPIR